MAHHQSQPLKRHILRLAIRRKQGSLGSAWGRTDVGGCGETWHLASACLFCARHRADVSPMHASAPARGGHLCSRASRGLLVWAVAFTHKVSHSEVTPVLRADIIAKRCKLSLLCPGVDGNERGEMLRAVCYLTLAPVPASGQGGCSKIAHHSSQKSPQSLRELLPLHSAPTTSQSSLPSPSMPRVWRPTVFDPRDTQ